MTKRVMSRVAGVVLAGILSAAAGDWPHFLGPHRNGVSDETGLLDAFPEGGPPRVWEREVGTGYSAPSVLGDVVVLHHRVGNEEIVEAMSVADGKTLWREGTPCSYVDPFGYNNGPRCSAILAGDRVYTFGVQGRLSCRELRTGALLWERETAREWNVPDPFFGVGSSPVLEGGRLFVMVGGQPNSGMVALDPETGRTLWEGVGRDDWEGVPMTIFRGQRVLQWKDYDKMASYATPFPGEVGGEPALFCLMRQGLAVVAPDTGKVRAKFFFRSSNEYSVNATGPVVVGNEIFISNAYYRTGSAVLAWDREAGTLEPVWRDTVLEIHWQTPIHHEGHLYAFSGRNEPDARLRCVEWKTGTLRWDRDESWGRGRGGQPSVYGRGSLVKADGRLIALGEGGLLGLFALDPGESRELARHQVPSLSYPTWAGPVLADGRLYLRDEDSLVCLDFRKR